MVRFRLILDFSKSGVKKKTCAQSNAPMQCIEKTLKPQMCTCRKQAYCMQIEVLRWVVNQMSHHIQKKRKISVGVIPTDTSRDQYVSWKHAQGPCVDSCIRVGVTWDRWQITGNPVRLMEVKVRVHIWSSRRSDRPLAPSISNNLFSVFF